MAEINTISKIVFNANIDGRWYNRVYVPINANNGYTNEDIDTKNGTIFSTRIGKDLYDIRVYKNKSTDKYAIKNVIKFERNESGNWENAKEQPKVRINNVKVKFCDGIFK